MQWYIVQNNEQVGPMDLESLLERIRSGGVVSRTLVWKESFGDDWRAAGTVPELAACFGPASRPGERGTGGDTPNGDLMRMARAALSGNWGLSIAVILLFWIVLMASSMATFGLASVFLEGALIVGLLSYFLALARSLPETTMGRLFDGFACFGSSLGLFWLIAWMMFVWSLLSVLITGLGMGALAAMLPALHSLWQIRLTPSGVSSLPSAVLLPVLMAVLIPSVILTVVQLRYALAFFALADHPEQGARAALSESIELMRGRKWKLFCLYWRFFGWMLLCLLTCGIGFLWLAPYMATSYAMFYEDARSAER